MWRHRALVLLAGMVVMTNVGWMSASRTKVIPFAKFHVRILNQMSHGEPVTMKCYSLSDNLGQHTLATGQSFEFGFKIDFLCATRFWCDAWHGEGKSYLWFNCFLAAKPEFEDKSCEDRWCIWIFKDNGVTPSTGRGQLVPWGPAFKSQVLAGEKA